MEKPDPPGGGFGHPSARGGYPTDAQLAARNPCARLHPDGARQRPERVSGHKKPRVQKLSKPGGDGHIGLVRLDVGRGCFCRIHLRLERPGERNRGGAQHFGFAGYHGRGADHRGDVCPDQHFGRCRLCLA